MPKCSVCGEKSLFLKVDYLKRCANCRILSEVDENKKELDIIKKELRDSDRLYKSIKEAAIKEAFDSIEDELEAKRNQMKSELDESEKQIADKNKKIRSLSDEISVKRKQVIQLDDEILFQEFGLYEPKYDFCNADEYKLALKKIRDKQKLCVKNGRAIEGNTSWTVNNSSAQGAKMLKDMQKLLLRAFNNECDTLVEKVKYHNYYTYSERIQKSCDAISRLGRIMDIRISSEYLSYKLDEIELAYEYQLKKQEEKEEQKELREQLREEKRLQKEIEEARKKSEKEKKHYTNELNKLKNQLENASEDKQLAIEEKVTKIEAELKNIEKAIKDIDYREANQRAGYVYIISNIGSFGKDIYKIGMTRRLDPYERVYELSDASVPFNFDVHAMIFTEDAPKLEASLHKAFESNKINLVNQRREFFNVPLQRIKEEIRKNHDKVVEFIDIPEAEQYRRSDKMRGKY